MTNEKKDKIKQLRNYLSTMDDAQRQELASKVGIVSIDGHSFSITNQCLMAFQNPDVTIVGGFNQFKQAGRMVKKGEHGMVIFYPSARKNEETGEDDINFYCGTVFDISQTQLMAEKESVNFNQVPQLA